MIAPTGLWLPVHAPPRSFTDWLREHYNANLSVCWSKRRNRYMLARRVGRAWKPFYVIETDDGEYLGCGEAAKARIARDLVHRTEFDRSERIADEIERDWQRRHREKRARDIRDALRDNKHQLISDRVYREPKPKQRIVAAVNGLKN